LTGHISQLPSVRRDFHIAKEGMPFMVRNLSWGFGFRNYLIPQLSNKKRGIKMKYQNRQKSINTSYSKGDNDQ